MAHKDDNLDRRGKPIEWVPNVGRANQPNYLKGIMEDGLAPMPTMDDVLCEMQLQAIGDFAPLAIKIDETLFKKQIAKWEDKWVPYLPREGVTNDREGLLVIGPDGFNPDEGLSMPEIRRKLGKPVSENDCNVPTELYHDLTSLHPILNVFDSLGRTMLVKLNKGGWFPPHRDSPHLSRDCFRIVGFIGKETGPSYFEWEHDYKRVLVEPNKTYYVDTRKTHRTASWESGGIHLVINVPKTWENVLKVLSITDHF